MKSMHQNIFFLLCFSLLGLNSLSAQQTIEAEMLKNAGTNHNCLFNPSSVTWGSVYHNKIELKQLDAGQAGYAEFSYTAFDNSEIWVGLQNQGNTTQKWMFQFLNGVAMINGTNHGTPTAGTVFRVERCDASVKFYIGGSIVEEIALTDINFIADALVEVVSGNFVGGNAPRLSLQFPFLNNCTSTPSGYTSDIYYADLKKQLDAGYVRLTTPRIYFKWIEEYAIVPSENDVLHYKIYAWHNNETPVDSGNLSKQTGTNEMLIFPNNISFNTYYTLEVKDAKGQKYYLRFLYYCPPQLNCPLNNVTGDQPQDN